jgi:probable addiction module antidote protein
MFTVPRYNHEKNATTPYDVAEHLRTPQDAAAYLEACFEDANGNAAFIAKALGDIARARGMSQVAQQTGMSREKVFIKRFLGKGTPALIQCSKS